MILFSDGRALMGRGALGAAVVKAGDQEASLASITKVKTADCVKADKGL